MSTRIDGGYVDCVYVVVRLLFIRYSYCFRRIYLFQGWKKNWQRQIRGRSWIKSRQPFQDYHRIAQGPICCSSKAIMWSGAKTAIRNQNDGGGLAVHNTGGLQFSIPKPSNENNQSERKLQLELLTKKPPCILLYYNVYFTAKINSA